MGAYYNEIDRFAAEWLRQLIRNGHIAPGDVDERDIRDVAPDDLVGYTQCHFFAGIGVWPYALRSAGWGDDEPVWTGSCPCQPFSAAGRRGGTADERHLWPAFFHLIEGCRPPVVFGEQVASKDGLAWLDLVQADMEGTGYTCWPFDLCAAGVGAPHIRQRLYFVAHTDYERRAGEHALLRAEEAGRLAGGISEIAGRCRSGKLAHPDEQQRDWSGNAGPAGWGELADDRKSRKLADAPGVRRIQRRPTEGAPLQGERPFGAGKHEEPRYPGKLQRRPEGLCGTGVAQGDTNDERPQGWRLSAERARELFAGQTGVAGFWRDADWIWCRDQKYRPVEPGASPLAHGSPARVGRLRAYGNAIVAPLAEELIRAYREVMGGL